MTDYTGSYDLDTAHSTIAFIVRHATVTKVRGTFNEWTSSFVIDGTNSKVTADIKAASIDTANADRDNHVKGEDFFDVEKYPEITFSSTEVDVDGGKVTGDLTIHGVTKPVTLDVDVLGTEEDPMGNTRVGFEATTKIDRRDFGIDFQIPLKSGGMILSNDIKIEIDGSAVKK